MALAVVLAVACGKVERDEVGTPSGGSGSGGSGDGVAQAGGTGGDDTIIVVSPAGGAAADDGSCHHLGIRGFEGDVAFDCQERGTITVTLGDAPPVVLDHPGVEHVCDGVLRIERLNCYGEYSYSLDAHAAASGLGGAGGDTFGSDGGAWLSFELGPTRALSEASAEAEVRGLFGAPDGTEWSFRSMVSLFEPVGDGTYALEFFVEALGPDGSTRALTVSLAVCPAPFEFCV